MVLLAPLVSSGPLTIVTEVQRWYIGNSRQAGFEHLAASAAETISTEIQFHVWQHLIWRNTQQHAPDITHTHTELHIDSLEHIQFVFTHFITCPVMKASGN